MIKATMSERGRIVLSAMTQEQAVELRDLLRDTLNDESDEAPWRRTIKRSTCLQIVRTIGKVLVKS